MGTHPYLIAGVLAGIAGLLIFLLLHHLWIRPIWFILPVGLVMAIVGGLAIGWAFFELSPGLPPTPWTSFSVSLLIVAILLPSFLLAEFRQPLFSIQGKLLVSAGRAAAIFVLELCVTAILVGGLVGWRIGGTSRAAFATALAGLAFALGPGHNIPFIGGTPGVGKELAIMGAIIIVSSLVLVGSQSLLARSPGLLGLLE